MSKKLRKTRVPSYRLHKASGQAVVTLNGKDHYLGLWGTTTSRREYDRVVGEWQVNGRSLSSSIDSVSVAELTRQYLRHAKTYYVKNGVQTDEFACIKSAVRVLLKTYKDADVDDFGPIALEAVRNTMIVDCGWSRDYINKSIGRIKRMFRWGVAKEIVPASVHQALMALDGLKQGKTIAKELPPVLPVDDKIINEVLKHSSPQLSAMIRIQRLTGMRPGEIRHIRPCDIDRSGDVWIYRPHTHKMEHKGRGRSIPIGPKAQPLLLPYLLRESTSYCFTNRRGKMVERWNYDSWIKRATRRAFPAPKDLSKEEKEAWYKSQEWAPNRMRHTAGTEFRREFGIESTRTVLGHSKASTTEIYAEKDLESAIKVARKLG